MPAADAGPQQGWTWQRTTYIHQPVEQESPNFFNCAGAWGGASGGTCAPDESTWVTNPTGCVWDVDDSYAWAGSSDLAKGTSQSATACAVADQYDNFAGDDHSVQAVVSAPSGALAVTVTSDQGDAYTATPVYDKASRAWVYRVCELDLTPGPYPTIDGSNGGTGTVVNWTITVTNNTGQAVKRVTAILQLGLQVAGQYSTGCP